MRLTKRMILVALTLLVGVGCKSNPRYCEGEPGNNCELATDAADDGAVDALDAFAGCLSDEGCAGSADTVCNLTTNQCVQCHGSDDAACMGATPTCGIDDTCHPCSVHTDCPSLACLPDGSCGSDGNVAYVNPSGTDNTACTRETPCTIVASALATARPFVKFTGMTSEQVTIDSQNVTLLADPGAELTTNSTGVILTVEGTSVVSIYDLTITGGLSATSGIGISMPAGNSANLTLTRASVTNNAGGGISVSGGTLTVNQGTVSGNTGAGISASGGTLTVSRSTVSVNAGGGVSLSNTQFDITNCFIALNGGLSSTTGGISIASIPASGSHRLDFNTVTSNEGVSTANSGVNCGTVGSPVTFSNNIIFGNIVSGGGKQIGGSVNCLTAFSDIGPDTAVGSGNINADPLFVNPSQNNYHIMSTSPAKDTADPLATLNIDFDGDARPQGPRSDMGADEFKP